MYGSSGVCREEHTHEEVVGIWVWSTNSEQLHQVVKLAMDISANRDRAFLGVRQSLRYRSRDARLFLPLAGRWILLAIPLVPATALSACGLILTNIPLSASDAIRIC